MSIHAIGVIGLVLVFVIGTLRPVNLGALALVATFLVGTVLVREPVRDLYTGFPVDLLLLLVGVTYLFGVASSNGTIERIVESSARFARGRRALIPWVVFVVASLPAMAGALGSAGVALLAPISLSLAKRCDIDRRMIGLMVVHGAAAGNFSPLNVLSAIVHQAVESNGLEMSRMALFAGNLAYNVALAAIIFIVFGGLRLSGQRTSGAEPSLQLGDAGPGRIRGDQICTVLAVVAVAFLAFVFGLSIGFLALTAAVLLTLLFPASSTGAEKKIAWGVVLLVCGIVTYVAALQHGTVDAIGGAIGRWSTPLVTALLICAVGAVTSAFASSAGILGAMVPHRHIPDPLSPHRL